VENLLGKRCGNPVLSESSHMADVAPSTPMVSRRLH